MHSSVSRLALVLPVFMAGCSTHKPASPPPNPTASSTAPQATSVPPATAAPVTASYTPTTFAQLPQWREQFSPAQWGSLASAIAAQCMGNKLPSAKALGWSTYCVEWRSFEAQLSNSRDPGNLLREWVETRFKPWRWQRLEADGNSKLEGLLTGYYEASLTVSRTPTAQFNIPIYKVPSDLLRLDIETVYPEAKGQRLRGRLERATPISKIVPYYSRAEIESGDLLKGQELLWTNDRIQLFFTHIQGSARAVLPDGQVLRIGYAEQNGHKYVAIGRTIVAQKGLTQEAVTMQSIESWLRANPGKMIEVLHSNPSYIFMAQIPAPKNDSQLAKADGAVGSLGVALTPQRSVAVDPAQVPLGSLLVVKNDTLQRLVVAQDTGGAIRGSLRADYYTGYGKAAADQAGVMKSPTQFWLLWPTGETPVGH